MPKTFEKTLEFFISIDLTLLAFLKGPTTESQTHKYLQLLQGVLKNSGCLTFSTRCWGCQATYSEGKLMPLGWLHYRIAVTQLVPYVLHELFRICKESASFHLVTCRHKAH